LAIVLVDVLKNVGGDFRYEKQISFRDGFFAQEFKKIALSCAFGRKVNHQ
jgi:hypothetical protein